MAVGHAGLALDTLRRLVPLDASLTLHTLRCLMTLDAGLTLHTLRPRLLALRTLDALRTLGPLPLGSLCRSELLTLHARRALRPLFTTLSPLRLLAATPALRGSLTVLAASMRPRIRRGCDRQRGNAGCEKNPGHTKSPSNGNNGPVAPPFQPPNGWNLHPIALG